MNRNSSGRQEPLMAELSVRRSSWLVLLVDDEPEVHEISKLVLAGTTFADLPVELHSAYSAREAMAFLQQHPDTALVLLDVVMETDDAGLALVQQVRSQLNNHDVQIVLRTGQPGMAPERNVILQFEINGYFLKTEMTAQKLCSIVIASLRAYQYIRSLREPAKPVASPQAASDNQLQQQAMKSALSRAIRNNELYLLAQPELHLASDTIAGIELIPSWKTNEGILGLPQISGHAQDLELRAQFDRWLIRQACAWAQSWQTLRSSPMRVSIPLLTERPWNDSVLSVIEQCRADFTLAHGTLDLEVTENTLLQTPAPTREKFALLQSRGVFITLVDFGSGMISLPLLSRLLPNRVKIHRSYVRNVAGDRERAAIARSIIALSHTLGLNVVADGIATELDLQFFRWEGCDLGQGDLLARSIGVTEVAQVLNSNKTFTH